MKLKSIKTVSIFILFFPFAVFAQEKAITEDDKKVKSEAIESFMRGVLK